MVTVPTYSPSVQTRPAFRQDLTVQATPEGFGAAVGRGLQSVAQGVGQVAEAQRAVTEMEDVTRAKEADNALAEWARNAMYGDNGYMTLEGKAAVDARSAFETSFEQKRKEFAQGLTHGAQLKYADASEARMQAAKQDVIVHSAQQRKVWIKEASAARVDTFGEDALAGFSDPARVSKNIALGQAELRQQAALEGWDADTLANKEAEFISGVHKSIALRMAVDDPLAAKKYADDHATELTGPHQLELEVALSADVKKEQAKQAAAAILEEMQKGNGDVIALLDKIEDPEVREMARITVSATLSMQEAADKKSKEAATEQAYKLMEQDRTLSPYDLPAEITQVIGMEGMKQLMEFWDKRAKGQDVTDDQTLYNLRTLYASDPVAFSKEDLFKYRNDLSDADWKEVTGWRQTAIQDQRKAVEDGASLTGAFSQANDALAGVGLTTAYGNEDQKKAAAGRIAQFNNVLANRIEEFKAANNGKNPDQAEVQAMINQLLLPIVIQTPKNFWSLNPLDAFGGYNETPGFLFEAGNRPDGTAVDLRVEYADIPADLREGIGADLARDLGRQPSEEEIVQRYETFLLAGP